MPTLLIVDDEPNVLYSLEKGLGSETLAVITAGKAGQAIAMVEKQRPDAVILDVRLPDMSGLDAFDRICRIDPRLPVIIITAYASTETAIEAMKRGAFDYLLKPIDLRELRDAVAKALQISRMARVRAVFDQDDEADASVDRIVGLSPPMQQVYKDIGRVAPQDVNVLILGESGTGKELVARAIYHHSQRSGRPFLAINCAAIPESLLESELFGHERGAFTGAERRRIGKFEQASGGTVFLDEIGDMSVATQAKILRLLQDGRFERVGGNETIQTDVRVIAATNQNLEELIAAGRFRQDLYYRLKVFSIYLPPLRQRMDDLPMLVEHLVKRFCRELGKPLHTMLPETLEALQEHDWPGNIRELQSAIKYALVQATGEVLSPKCLPDSVQAARPGAPPSPAGPGRGTLDIAGLVRRLLDAGEHDVYRRVQLEMDRILLDQILRHAEGNQVMASQLLGISRTTLRSKLSTLESGERS
jgi:nitrogen regulation protein NR(I)